jgi:predicted TIM-barrel fold metal-dependent hydrolase
VVSFRKPGLQAEPKAGVSRRDFLRRSAIVASGAAALTAGCSSLEKSGPRETIIDIHQHVNYAGRSNTVLLAHQRAMGISKTILLPAGRPLNRPSTNNAASNGLEAKCLGNEECYQFALEHPTEFRFAANEVPDIPEAVETIEKYLKLGAVAIAEQKFAIDCDSPEMQRLYELAGEYRVPILMHWQYQRFNYGFERFHKMLEKFPNANFIGHAQTWWANIDAAYQDNARNLYPKGKVTPGGLTDRYLRDYPNMYGDLSAGSGLNALKRDEDHARAFLHRHQEKLVYGSDCDDLAGAGEACQGAQTIAEVRRLAPEAKVRRKLFSENARRLFGI